MTSGSVALMGRGSLETGREGKSGRASRAGNSAGHLPQSSVDTHGPSGSPLCYPCDGCARACLVFAQIGNRFLCWECSRGLNPDRFVRAKE